MPQLMPLYWIISTIMVIVVMITFIMMFSNKNLENFILINKEYSEVKLIHKW